MAFDRDVYFDHVRDTLFDGALTQQQVDGQSVILAVWEYQAGGTPMTDVRWLAYMLATTFHETATRMWPTTEYGSQSYLQGKPYYPYIGRGFVQLTWEENYARAGNAVEEDLVNFPDMALQPDIASIIMFNGMRDGWFTGKKLSTYFSATMNDAYNARRIINGVDRAEEIKGYHEKFLRAVTEATGG